MAGIQDKLKGIDLKKLKDKLGSLFMGPQEILGVDIGSYSIKVVYLKNEGGAYRLKAWGHLPIETKPDASPDDRKQQTVNTLRAFLIQKGLPVHHAATAISGNSVIVRYVKFPLLTKNELKATLATEAEPFIPFDIKDVQLSFHILSEVMEEGQKRMETVLVAAKKDAVQARVEVLEAVGLRPAIIDVDSFALENVHERGEHAAGGSTLYLNIGHTVTNLSIIEGNVTRVVRDIFISGSTFTKAVVKALQCDLAKAEEAKKSHGLLLEQEEKEKALAEGNKDALAVSQAVAATMKDLVAEVHRSVDFYLSQGPERSVSRIVLSGGTARMKNLSKYLTAELKVPVSLLDPFASLGQPADIPPDLLPTFGVAVGLGLRRNRDWA
ncbi:MAG: type IV pilus assembly protein PilM [Elusimicrobiota bacterium]|jgi:type IV pilus assembly protein PilM